MPRPPQPKGFRRKVGIVEELTALGGVAIVLYWKHLWKNYFINFLKGNRWGRGGWRGGGACWGTAGGLNRERGRW